MFQPDADGLMNNLTDNKKVDYSLRKRANVIVDAISAYCPALDRITLDENKFNTEAQTSSSAGLEGLR